MNIYLILFTLDSYLFYYQLYVCIFPTFNALRSVNLSLLPLYAFTNNMFINVYISVIIKVIKIFLIFEIIFLVKQV